MKTVIAILMILLYFSLAPAQFLGVPRDVEFTLQRIEHAFATGNPSGIDDLISSSIIMRLNDSLYYDISSIRAMDLLKKFFANIDSLQFNFNLPGTGQMIYYSGGKKYKDNVDVWIYRRMGDIGIRALNISNYPTATVFFDHTKHKNLKK
jgi:hypothetical protein